MVQAGAGGLRLRCAGLLTILARKPDFSFPGELEFNSDSAIICLLTTSLE
jgi:hypothetical protein